MRTVAWALVVMIASLMAAAQTAAPALTPALHILAPQNGENINNGFVTVQYELASSASAASTPTFQLRLDSRDPVQTTDTQYTFTGLPAGTHIITIEVVDANNTPLPGVQNQVQFTIQPAAPQGAGALTQSSAVRLQAAAMTSQQPPNWRSAAEEANSTSQASRGELPKSGSALPLISVIGMGVLVGGIASALRTNRTR